jgi:hypothetical protein
MGYFDLFWTVVILNIINLAIGNDVTDKKSLLDGKY